MWKLRSSKLSEKVATREIVDGTAPAKLVEELEDLRYNYKESVRLNLRYEQLLNAQSGQ